jgi:DNA-binding NarL/FixJ family response regulator
MFIPRGYTAASKHVFELRLTAAYSHLDRQATTRIRSSPPAFIDEEDAMPGRGPAPDAARLSAPEEQVARLVVEGRTNPGVALALGITPRTVELHLSRIYRKLGVRTRRDLENALRRFAASGGAELEEEG